MKVYIQQRPRSLVVAGSKRALVIRMIKTDEKEKDKEKDKEKKRSCLVELAHTPELELRGLHEQRAECFGVLGLINMGNDVFLCTITSRAEAAEPMPGRIVWRIYGVEFYCLTRPYSNYLDPQSLDPEQLAPQRGKNQEEHVCAGIHKLLISGYFYYSTDFDLTAVVQNSSNLNSAPFDESFMWNTYMIGELMKFRVRLPVAERHLVDEEGFLTCAIHGFVETKPCMILPDTHGRLSVISRQSWRRAGTRYNARGIDDKGNVANFVETETVLWLQNGQYFSYVQLRGSVPTFWEQDANLLGAKLQFTRSEEASQRAFQRHFSQLVERFGAVHCIDLLSTKSGEAELSLRYRKHLKEAENSLGESVRYTHFDFHRAVAGSRGYAEARRVIDKIQESMEEFAFYSYNPQTGQTDDQTGVFRTNCMDCLDRTNLVQQLVSRDALEYFLACYHYPITDSDDLWTVHASLWADNGDQLSMIYTGTNALKSSYTRSGKMNFAGALSDATKSISRLYVNNFIDKSRQTYIEFILGRGAGQVEVSIYDPINDWVTEQLKWRTREFSSPHEIQIYAGTFNVNGKTPDVDLTPWLFPPEMEQFPDLYLIGLQELVELTPGQILNTDPTRKQGWSEGIGKCLNRRKKYDLLSMGQLVGTTVMVFVKESEMDHINEVDHATKKTAFGGITGNKGGVGLSFKYGSTSICFVNSHLAAGENNAEERHHHYTVLYNGLRFSHGMRLMTQHDLIIWLGDFNFRIELPNDTVRSMLKKYEENPENNEMIHKLLNFDQLNRQMEEGVTFPYFKEGDITFMPTYKYDPGTDRYDTSEKMRTPSYTDRILCRGSHITQLCYNVANSIRFSDHRPVYAVYDAEVKLLNEAKREILYNELYAKRRDQLGDANYLVHGEEFDVQALNKQTSATGLPPPSTDAKKWWQDGQPSKVPIVPPRPGQVLNPQKINPFTKEGKKMDNFVDSDSVRTMSITSLSTAPDRKPVPTPALPSQPPRPQPPTRPSSTVSQTSQQSKLSQSSGSLLDGPSDNISWKPLI